jgi:hypothetical protein
VLQDFTHLTSADASEAGQPSISDHIHIRSLEGDPAVANREQRGNREKRKPKAEKPKSPVQASPFARPQAIAAPKGNGNTGKKGR